MHRPRLLPLVLIASFVAALAVAIFFASASAAPAVRFVTVAGAGVSCTQPAPCSLQTALAQANSGDYVYVAAGTYTGAGGAVVTVTKSITLYGGWDGAPAGPVTRNPYIYFSRLDAQDVRRGVYIAGPITPTLDGFTVMHGNATGMTSGCLASAAGGCGGGIYVDQAHARIMNNVVISNTALVTTPVYAKGYGGGIYLQNLSNATLSGNLVFNNAANRAGIAQGQGGGIDLEDIGTGVLLDSNQVISNSAPTWGGGIAVNLSLTPLIANNQLINNEAVSGAAAYEWISAGTLLTNLASGNQGDSAFYIGYSPALVAANSIFNNTTNVGLYLTEGAGNVRVVNNIIARNGATGIRAYGYPGGVLTATLIYNTLVGAGSGNAVVIEPGASAQLRFTNTLVSGFTTAFANNTPTATLTARTTLLDAGVLQGNGTLTGVLHGAPAFLDPAHFNYHIGANSAARDAGVATLPNIDVDGGTRPLGLAPDIGADETIYDSALFLPSIAR